MANWTWTGEKPEKPRLGDIAELRLAVSIPEGLTVSVPKVDDIAEPTLTVSVRVTDIDGDQFQGNIVGFDDGNIGDHVKFSSKHVFGWMTGS